MSRLPHENYVKYLLLSGLEEAHINELLLQYSFPPTCREELRVLRRRLHPPKPFRPNAGHRMTDQWLLRQGFYPLFEKEEHALTALGLLENPDVRPLLEGLLLSGAEAPEVVDLLEQRFKVRYDKEVVQLYQNFFWNRGLLSQSDWEKYLAGYSLGPMLRGLYEEGPQMAAWHLGFAVSELDANEMLRSIQTEAYYRFMQTHRLPNDRSTALQASMWADIVMSTHKQLSQGNAKLAEVISQFQAIFMKKSAEAVPALEDLSGTVSKASRKRLEAPPQVVIEVDNRTLRLADLEQV